MSEIKIKPALTDIGKKRLSEGKFDITKATVSDDGVNYRLIDTSFQDPLLQLKRTRLFDVWKDATSIMENKIPRDEEDLIGIGKKIKLNFEVLRDEITINKMGEPNEVDFPNITNTGDGNRFIDFYATSQNEFGEERDIRIEIPFENNPAITKRQFLTFTLENCRYFDIALTEENKKNFKEEEDFTDIMVHVTSNGNELIPMSASDFQKMVDSTSDTYYIQDIYKKDEDMFIKNKLFDISLVVESGDTTHNIYKRVYTYNQLKALLSGHSPKIILNEVKDTGLLHKPIEDRNHEDSVNLGITKSDETSKTVNVFCTKYRNSHNSLILRYRGNYDYDTDSGIYSTYLTVFSETTGHFDKIKLNLISAQPLQQ